MHWVDGWRSSSKADPVMAVLVEDATDLERGGGKADPVMAVSVEDATDLESGGGDGMDGQGHPVVAAAAWRCWCQRHRQGRQGTALHEVWI